MLITESLLMVQYSKELKISLQKITLQFMFMQAIHGTPHLRIMENWKTSNFVIGNKRLCLATSHHVFFGLCF